MGLDFSHGDVHFAYSGFHTFRKKIAQDLGFDLKDMIGFGGKKQWSELKPDDIYLFLNHSDCDGELSPSDLNKIIPRLEEITKDWKTDESWASKDQADKLIEAMKDAADAGEHLIFC